MHAYPCLRPTPPQRHSLDISLRAAPSGHSELTIESTTRNTVAEPSSCSSATIISTPALMAHCSSSALHDQIRFDLERRRKVVNAARERVARKSFASPMPSPRQPAPISSMSNGAVAMNRPNAMKQEVANKRSAPAQPHRPATTNAAGKKIYYLDLGEAPARRPVPRTMRILTSSSTRVSGVASGTACRSALIPSVSNSAAAVNPANVTKEAIGKKRSAPPSSLPHQSATTTAAGKKIAYMELGEAKRRCTAPPRRSPPRQSSLIPTVSTVKVSSEISMYYDELH